MMSLESTGEEPVEPPPPPPPPPSPPPPPPPSFGTEEIEEGETSAG
jgi:hypothetical protein